MNTNPPPKVSVIMAARNPRETWLRQALNSVLNQSFLDFEMIVMDDGSAESFAHVLPADTRFRYVRGKSSVGVSMARNQGVALSRGSVLTFLDCDDFWNVGKLLADVQALSSNTDAPLVDTDFLLIDGDDVPKSQQYAERLGTLPELLYSSGMIPSACAIRREAFQAAGGFDVALTHCEDWDLFLRLAWHGPIVRVRRPLVAYRLHGENASKDWRSTYEAAGLVSRKYMLAARAQNRADLLPALRGGRHFSRLLHSSQAITSARMTFGSSTSMTLQSMGFAALHSPSAVAREVRAYTRARFRRPKVGPTETRPTLSSADGWPTA